jgi:hypothetical protein
LGWAVPVWTQAGVGAKVALVVGLVEEANAGPAASMTRAALATAAMPASPVRPDFIAVLVMSNMSESGHD